MLRLGKNFYTVAKCEQHEYDYCFFHFRIRVFLMGHRSTGRGKAQSIFLPMYRFPNTLPTCPISMIYSQEYHG